ncbi:MAG: glycosyltransferase family 4 protein [Patescibacteria group bacterium]|nr:glycosyltransferase family 4 protein [Patescibacteria group bacterium]
MKILMLTPYVPYPPSSGGQVRTYNLLKYLSKNHKIYLVCLYKNEEEKKYQEKLSFYCKKIYFCKRSEKPFTLKNILKAVLSNDPFLIVRNHSKEAKNILKKLVENEQFDIIHAETFYIMPHLPKINTPIFLLEQTIEYKVYQHFVNSLPFIIKWLFYLDVLKLKKSEIFYWKNANKVGAVSENDAKIIKNHLNFISPIVIPNGAGEDLLVKKLRQKNLKKPLILFVGNFSWLQNTEAALYLIKKIYPLIKNIKNINLIIAGQNALKKLGQIKEKNIKIIDVKPNDKKTIKKLYQKANLFIAPIFGPGGTRLKILGAMASGIPIISTTTGITGLDIKENKEVLIANNPQEFSDKIKKIISDKNFYEKIRINAYNLVKEKYNWKIIAKKLEKVYYNMKYDNRN